MKTFTLYTICIMYHEFPLAKRDSSGKPIIKNVDATVDYDTAIQSLSNYVSIVNTYISNNTTNMPIDLFTLKKVSDTTYAAESFNAPVISISIVTNELNCLESTEMINLLDNIY